MNKQGRVEHIIQINLTNENESVICAAVRCFGAMADDSQTKFGDLLTAFSTLANFRHGKYRNCLYLTIRRHSDISLLS